MPSVSEHLLDTAVVYTELAKGGTCNFGEVYTTDGRVASLKLNVVQDDKKFFPIYNPALSVRSDVAKKYPGLETLFKPIARAAAGQRTPTRQTCGCCGIDVSSAKISWI